MNYSFDNRYFVDLSGRIDGSSKYGGKDKRFAPLWSAGIGWNINNEHFLEGADWLDPPDGSGSIGLTGNPNFDPYVARTTMQFDMDQVYYQALGASFMALEIKIWNGNVVKTEYRFGFGDLTTSLDSPV